MDDDEKRAEIARLQAELDTPLVANQVEIDPTVDVEGVDPTVPPRDTRPWIQRAPAWALFSAVAAVVVVGLVAVVWFAGADDRQAKQDAEDRADAQELSEILDEISTREVTYQVTGTAQSISITIETPGGGTSQQDNLAVPLQRADGRPMTFVFSAGDFVYLSAQNEGDSGSVTCEILVDGESLSKVTSSGAYVIAGCDGSA